MRIMNKRVFIFGVLAIAMVLAGCQPSIDTAKSDFCDDLGTFALAVGAYRSLGPTSSVDDFQSAQEDVDTAWNDVQSSAQTLQNVQIDSLQSAYSDLQKDVSNISGDTSIADAVPQIRQDALATLGESVKILTTTCSYGQ
jgi:hypothetical protein